MLTMVVAPLGIANAGAQAYHFVSAILEEPTFNLCEEGCPFPKLIAKGDRTGLVVTGPHKIAECNRALRKRQP